MLDFVVPGWVPDDYRLLVGMSLVVVAHVVVLAVIVVLPLAASHCLTEYRVRRGREADAKMGDWGSPN